MLTQYYNSIFSNATIGDSIDILNEIKAEQINISIFQRTLIGFEEEIKKFIDYDINFKLKGNVDFLIKSFKHYIKAQNLPNNYIAKDFSILLNKFKEITSIDSFRVYFSTVKTDMCRRFHTDFNNLRLLCTYYGPATLWLPEEIANRDAHHFGDENEQIVKDPTKIQQANAGDVLILKGALYPKAKAVIHKSPKIESEGQKRLLFRIDTSDFLDNLQ